MQFILTALFGLLFCSLTIAEEYVLYEEGNLRGVGTEWVAEMQITSKDGKTYYDMDGQQSVADTGMNGEARIRAKVLSNTSFSYVLEAESFRYKIINEGVDDSPPEERNPIVGIPFTITYKDNTWRAEPNDERELNEEEREKINDYVDSWAGAETLYGTKPRKIGDTWKGSVSAWFGTAMNWKNKEGELTITFEDVVMLNGRKCAKIRFDIDAEGSVFEGDSTMRAVGSSVVYRDLEHLTNLFIDGNMKTSFTYKGDGFTMNSVDNLHTVITEKIVSPKKGK